MVRMRVGWGIGGRLVCRRAWTLTLTLTLTLTWRVVELGPPAEGVDGYGAQRRACHALGLGVRVRG